MGLNRLVPAVLVLALVLVASAAGAATITGVTGMVKLNGEAVSGDIAFPTGGVLEVIGEGSRATVVTASGDRIVLEPGSKLTLNVVTEEKETFELATGSFMATLSPGTEIMLPGDSRLTIPEGTAELSVDSREGGTRTALDVNEGKAILHSGDQFKTVVTSRQSATVTFKPSTDPRAIVVETGPDNEGNVAVFDKATADLEIEVRVPKASKSKLASVENNTKTKIENSLDSSKEGKLGIVSRVKGEETARGEVAPGVFAYVLHASGAIEFEYVEIDFQVLARAIGLTNEFATLAVSNYTGVKPPNPKAPRKPDNMDENDR
jgi:hypothetical protein